MGLKKLPNSAILVGFRYPGGNEPIDLGTTFQDHIFKKVEIHLLHKRLRLISFYNGS